MDYLSNRILGGLSGDQASTSTFFVCCFSSEYDDLSQWRAYGGGKNGIALGFDLTSLYFSGLALARAGLFKVIYNVEQQRALANRIALATIEFFIKGIPQEIEKTLEQWADDFFLYWTNEVNMFAPIVKNPKFSSENEWRLVRRLSVEDRAKMVYLQKSTLISRHLPLELRYASGSSLGNPLLPLREVMIGPSRHSQVSKISIADLLLTTGYNQGFPLVTVSEAPFQLP